MLVEDRAGAAVVARRGDPDARVPGGVEAVPEPSHVAGLDQRDVRSSTDGARLTGGTQVVAFARGHGAMLTLRAQTSN